MNLTAVLLPGLDGSGKQFAPLQESLGNALSTRIVAYSPDSTNYEDHLSQVMAALPIQEPYVLVAESYSGPVAIRVAARRPEGLKGLVLCASFAKCPRAFLSHFRSALGIVPPWKVNANWVAPLVLGRYKTADLLGLLEVGLSSVAPRVLLERLKGVARVDVSTEAQSVAVPALYLRATSDRLVPASAGAYVARCIPRITVRDLDGPHFLLQARADAASEEILSFASARVA